MAWQKVRIDIPDDLTATQRAQVAHDVVNQMVDNATNGVGVRQSGDKFVRKTFPAYTPQYQAKKGQSNVDLTLSGEMLSALKVISHKKGSILVGFDNGTEANSKAEGNILGSYGKDPNPKKARNFLGIIPSEIRKIVSTIRKDQ